jgi:hypothetical protein
MAQRILDETALVSSDTVQSVTNVTADKLADDREFTAARLR